MQGPSQPGPDLPGQPAALCSLPDAMLPRSATCFPAFGPMRMLCLLACDAHTLSQSCLTSQLRCHWLWEAFPITPGSDSRCSPGPPSEPLQYDLMLPVCLPCLHIELHSPQGQGLGPLAPPASGLSHCLLAYDRPILSE